MTLKAIIAQIFGFSNTPDQIDPLSIIDHSHFGTHAERKAIYQQIRALEYGITSFLDCSENVHEYVSLGQNCTIAWYLKQAALKEASYPFDWIFSSPGIIEDTINDQFGAFLDQKYLIHYLDREVVGHRKYHSQLFNHRNPIKNPGYYERSCERFLKTLNSGKSLVFIMLLLNEPEKRQDWRNGFDCDFPLPVNQTDKDITPLVEHVIEINRNAKFILVDTYTERESRSIVYNQISDEVLSIEVSVQGKSTGVYYTNILDDFLFKLLFLAFRC